MNIPDLEDEIGERILRYFHGELSEEETEALYQWIQASPENKTAFFQLKELYDLLTGNQRHDEKYVDSSWERMHGRLISIPRDVDQGMRRKKRVSLHLLSYAAVAAIALLIGIRMSFRSETALQSSARNEFYVQKGGQPDCVVLSDGTSIRMNAGSKLSCPGVFADSIREVDLDGEAWFEVARDSARPFIVILRQQRVVVHGTSFNVRAYGNERSSAITLASGAITLETCREDGRRLSSILLNPGEKAFFDREKETVSVEKVDATIVNAWMRGEYKFKDEPLEEIVKRLAVHYDVDIRLDDDLKNIRYTGTFSFDQSVNQALRVINHEKQFTFSQNGSTIYITRKKQEVKPHK